MEKYYTFYKIKLIMEDKLDIKLYNTFFNNGNCYQCIEGTSCTDCGLIPDSELCNRFFCNDYTRKDNTNVVFKKIFEYPNLNKVNMENTRTVKLTLAQARELYKKDELCKSIALNSFNKEELEESSLPETYEEALEIYRKNNDEYYTLYDTDNIHPIIEKLYIYKNSSGSKNPNFIFKSEELAEAFIALQQLILIRDIYNDGWEPDWTNGTCKYVICYDKNELVHFVSYMDQHVLYFKNNKLRNKFIKNFKPLIEKAKPLL